MGSFTKRFRKDCCWRIAVRLRRKRWFAALTITLVNVGFLMLGAYVMQQLEAGSETERDYKRGNLSTTLENLLKNCSKEVCDHLERDVTRLLGEMNKIPLTGVAGVSDWGDPWKALLYSASVMSTIGYGYLHPQTVSGQNFTMLFATITIPLVLLMLNISGEFILDLCRLLNKKTFAQCGCVNKIGKPKQRYTVLWTIIIVAMYMVLSSVVYAWAIQASHDNVTLKQKPWDVAPTTSVLQKNDFHHAFYFTFISFSTIGFGDFFIDVFTTNSVIGMILTIVLGLLTFSAFIAAFQNTVQKIIIKTDYLIVSDEADEDGNVLINSIQVAAFENLPTTGSDDDELIDAEPFADAHDGMKYYSKSKPPSPANENVYE